MRGGCPLVAWACPCRRTESWLPQEGGLCKSHSWTAVPASQATAAGLHLTWTACLGCGRPSPSAAGTPQAVHTDAWRGALQTPAGVHLGCCCLPMACLHFVTESVQPAKSEHSGVPQHRMGGISCMEFECESATLEHPELAEPSGSTVTVVRWSETGPAGGGTQVHVATGSHCVIASRVPACAAVTVQRGRQGQGTCAHGAALL